MPGQLAAESKSVPAAAPSACPLFDAVPHPCKAAWGMGMNATEGKIVLITESVKTVTCMVWQALGIRVC